jgi:hypothetical protein
MQTFMEALQDYGTDRGMSEGQADEVAKMVQEETHQGYRLNETVDNYPKVMLNIACMTFDTCAVKYIEEHCPLAWFKLMFTAEGRALMEKEYEASFRA